MYMVRDLKGFGLDLPTVSNWLRPAQTWQSLPELDSQNVDYSSHRRDT